MVPMKHGRNFNAAHYFNFRCGIDTVESFSTANVSWLKLYLKPTHYIVHMSFQQKVSCIWINI